MVTNNNEKMQELTVEEKLQNLYELQRIDTEIDKIKTLRGELPLEVQDLEDEIAGLETRIENLKVELGELDKTASTRKMDIKKAEEAIKKYSEQLDNVRNNREYDALSKEIEFQKLEIELQEKRIREAQKAKAEKEAPREGRDVDCQYEEQAEQNRHHDLVCLLNAACNAHYHDCERNDERYDLPYAVADAEEAGRRHCLEGFAEGLSLRCGHAERTADRAHVGAEAVQAAGDRQECVLEDPAENDRVADREHQRADDRDSAEGLASLVAAGPLLGAHAERAYRACLCAAAERELFNNTGSADQDNKKEIRQQEGHASVLLNHDRETPDIAHADGRTDTG